MSGRKIDFANSVDDFLAPPKAQGSCSNAKPTDLDVCSFPLLFYSFSSLHYQLIFFFL